MNKLEQLQRDKNGIGFIKSYPILLQLYAKGFNSNEKNIIELVLSYNDNDQAFKMKYKTIAEIFNIEYQTVKNTIAKLKKLNILSTNHKKNYNGVAGGSSTGLSVDIDYLVSLIQNKSITNQPAPAQETHPPVETEATEQESKPFDLLNYGDLICHEYDKAIESGLNINEATYIEYLNNAFTSGKLTKAEQMTSDNLKVILKNLVIKKLTEAECIKIIENKMTGGTIAQRKDTSRKVLQWFIEENHNKTQQEIEDKTFRTHHQIKTANRVIDQKHND